MSRATIVLQLEWTRLDFFKNFQGNIRLGAIQVSHF